MVNFSELVRYLHYCACAKDSTENRGLLTEQASPVPGTEQASPVPGEACPGSKLLHLSVQAVLLPVYCFAEEMGFYKSKLAPKLAMNV